MKNKRIEELEKKFNKVGLKQTERAIIYGRIEERKQAEKEFRELIEKFSHKDDNFCKCDLCKLKKELGK